MQKCVVCGTTAGYKITNTTDATPVQHMCLNHAVDTMTANSADSFTLEALPHQRKLGDFYNTGGYISAS